MAVRAVCPLVVGALLVKRIRPARHYQRLDDPTLRLSRSAMRSVARELRHAFTNLSSLVDTAKVVDALRHGKNPASTINFHHYREVLRGAFDRLGKLRHAGGALGARKINGLFAAKRRKVRFRKAIKATKAEANYRRTTSKTENCAHCTMYIQQFLSSAEGYGGTCTSVEGDIYAVDVCDFFEQRFVAGLDLKKATGDQFSFDSFSPDVQQQIRDAQDALIQQLESDARDSINVIINDGIANGTPLDDIAGNIKDMIGLTDTQSQAVLNYQRALMELDSSALQRGLRNADYDALIQDAIDSGSQLGDSAIESAVEDYIDNYLDYRAATIAQTESTRAANAGLHDAYSQAIDRGALPEDSVTRQWQLADNPCPICESIVDNNPDGVGVNESFDSDDGPVDDPPVHPNCECSVEYVTDLTQVPDDSEAEYEYQTQT